MKKKENQASKTFFEYRRMLNYFMTVFFIFLLMISILLFINLSRAVLSDSNIERHLTDTKSLLEELEEVEKSGANRFDNFSTNFSDYPQKALINRIEIDDISLYDTNKSEVAYLTLKSSNYTYNAIDSSIIITNVEPILYDVIIFKDNMSNFQRGLIVELYEEEKENLQNQVNNRENAMYIVLKDSSFINSSLTQQNSRLNQSIQSSQGIQNEIVSISESDIEGVELISN